LRLRIAMGLVGELGDELLEVARDAADGRVARRQLALDHRHLVGEARGQRLYRLLLRFLPEPFVPGEDGVDGAQERGRERWREPKMFAHPGLQLSACLRKRAGYRNFFRPHAWTRWVTGCQERARRTTSTKRVPDITTLFSRVFAKKTYGRVFESNSAVMN